jgi:hypothetical protein
VEAPKEEEEEDDEFEEFVTIRQKTQEEGHT